MHSTQSPYPARATPSIRSPVASCSTPLHQDTFFAEFLKCKEPGPNLPNAARTRVRSMGDLGSIDDAFDAALNLEESHIDEGWEDGLW